jgi:hypothetical protein
MYCLSAGRCGESKGVDGLRARRKMGTGPQPGVLAARGPLGRGRLTCFATEGSVLEFISALVGASGMV